jgi:hypothetical protein
MHPAFLNLGAFHRGTPEVGLIGTIFKTVKLNWLSDIAI